MQESTHILDHPHSILPKGAVHPLYQSHASYQHWNVTMAWVFIALEPAIFWRSSLGYFSRFAPLSVKGCSQHKALFFFIYFFLLKMNFTSENGNGRAGVSYLTVSVLVPIALCVSHSVLQPCERALWVRLSSK